VLRICRELEIAGGATMMKPRTTLTLVSLLAMGVAWAGYDGIPQVDQTHINDRRDGKENDYYKPSMIDLRHLNDQPYDDPRPATMLERFGHWKDSGRLHDIGYEGLRGIASKQVRTVRILPPTVPPARPAERIPQPVPRGSLKADRIPLPVPRPSLKADGTLPPKSVPPGWTLTSILSWLEIKK